MTWDELCEEGGGGDGEGVGAAPLDEGGHPCGDKVEEAQEDGDDGLKGVEGSNAKRPKGHREPSEENVADDYACGADAEFVGVKPTLFVLKRLQFGFLIEMIHERRSSEKRHGAASTSCEVTVHLFGQQIWRANNKILGTFDQMDEFRDVQKVGEGGYGVVYRARDAKG